MFTVKTYCNRTNRFTIFRAYTKLIDAQRVAFSLKADQKVRTAIFNKGKEIKMADGKYMINDHLVLVPDDMIVNTADHTLAGDFDCIEYRGVMIATGDVYDNDTAAGFYIGPFYVDKGEGLIEEVSNLAEARRIIDKKFAPKVFRDKRGNAVA